MMPLRTPKWLLAGVLTALALIAAMPARAQDPSAPTTEALFARAREAFADGNYDAAVGRYEEILRRDRTNLTAILELSNVYERTGRLEYARGLLIRATRIDPDYPAIEQRRRSVDAKLAASLSTEVDSLLQRGDCDAAIARLSLHNAIDPGNPSVHYKRAVCLFEMGRYDAALSDIDVAIAASPQEPYFLLRDRITGEMSRAEVKHLVAQARELSDSDVPRHRQQAIELLARILELNPDHTWARTEFERLNQDETERLATQRRAAEPAWKSQARTVWAMMGRAGTWAGRHVGALVALFIAVLLLRSPLSRALTRRLQRPSILSGDLSRFAVAEILTMLNAEPHTGVLEVRGRRLRGRVYFEGGEPRHCKAGGLEGVDALMELIERVRGGRFRFVRGRRPRRRTIDTPLSVLLVEKAHQANGVDVRPGVVKKSRMKELLDSRIEV